MRATALLVDLDGTIIDSAAGIADAIAYALAEFGRERPAEARLRSFVGPPLTDTFASFGFRGAELEAVVACYRDRYRSQGMLTAPVFEGMREWLLDEAASGRPMSLATSKPESAALMILEHHGLVRTFSAITGSRDDGGRQDKADVVAEALRRLRFEGADLTRPVMVGDRVHDVEGARANEVPTVFVSWGYGSQEESAHAAVVVDDVAGLRRAIDGAW